MYLKLMDDYEKEIEATGTEIDGKAHFARFEFALWLDRQAEENRLCSNCGEPMKTHVGGAKRGLCMNGKWNNWGQETSGR
jgi:NADH pyrophosphatase NudC (nudix superfamily)